MVVIRRTGAGPLAVLAVLLVVLPASAQTVCTASQQNPTVRFVTTLGDIDVLLCREDVALTVDNFVQYVTDGAYTNTGIIHRSVQPTSAIPDNIAIIQGGGAYLAAGDVMTLVETRAPIARELVGLNNTRGTIAMALGSNAGGIIADSATSQWFFNVQDNPALDEDVANPSLGFAVFGEVTAGLAVVDAMAAQTIWKLNDNFLAATPLINYPNDGSVVAPYLISITDIRVLPEPDAFAQTLGALVVLVTLAYWRRHESL